MGFISTRGPGKLLTECSPLTDCSLAVALPAQIEPLLTRQPQCSRGALLHGRGQCRPCAWYWKPQGCNFGEECCHCHLCPKGELKARKHQKKVAFRASIEES